MARSRHNPSAARAVGFTLVEAVFCCLIVGVVLVPTLEMIGATAVARKVQAEQTQGTSLARQLLSEIMQCRYADPDSDAGETRATWDDVSDYDNYSETSPTSRSGTALAGYTGWQRSAQVQWVDPTNPATTVGTDQGLKRITVTVQGPKGQSFTLTGLRSSGGAAERTPTMGCTYASWVDITLQASSGSGTVSTATSVTGVNLVNQIP
jgi:MSHA pilin protein MshD